MWAKELVSPYPHSPTYVGTTLLHFPLSLSQMRMYVYSLVCAGDGHCLLSNRTGVGGDDTRVSMLAQGKIYSTSLTEKSRHVIPPYAITMI